MENRSGFLTMERRDGYDEEILQERIERGAGYL